MDKMCHFPGSGTWWLENPGIDPGTSRMLSERSTMWANSPGCFTCPPLSSKSVLGGPLPSLPSVVELFYMWPRSTLHQHACWIDYRSVKQSMNQSEALSLQLKKENNKEPKNNAQPKKYEQICQLQPVRSWAKSVSGSQSASHGSMV